MNKCPNFPWCRFCHYLAWSDTESDFVCINPDYQKEDPKDEEQNT